MNVEEEKLCPDFALTPPSFYNFHELTPILHFSFYVLLYLDPFIWEIQLIIVHFSQLLSCTIAKTRKFWCLYHYFFHYKKTIVYGNRIRNFLIASRMIIPLYRTSFLISNRIWSNLSLISWLKGFHVQIEFSVVVYVMLELWSINFRFGDFPFFFHFFYFFLVEGHLI